MDSQDRREQFVIVLHAYLKSMLEESSSRESFHNLLSSLLLEGITFLMHEVEVEELENLWYDIEGYLDDLELSKDDFDYMFGEFK